MCFMCVCVCVCAWALHINSHKRHHGVEQEKKGIDHQNRL